MPFGYLISAVLMGTCVLAAVAPRRSPRPLAVACFRLGFVNELPFFAAYLLIGSTVLAAAQGDLNTPVGWLAFAISMLTLAGLGLLVARALPAHVGPPAGRTIRVPVIPMLLWPFIRRSFDVRRIANIRYGNASLDLYLRRGGGTDRPVFIHLHGGAFVGGRKNQESLPLIYHLARQGWLCISANYRLGPAASRHDQVEDIRQLLDWVRGHAGHYGGDPGTVVLAGGSAGAYLAARTALTTDDPAVRAVVMLYAYYGDLGTVDARPGTPPFLVLHGTNDTLVAVEDARRFVEYLRGRSASPVNYAELPGAGHTFDIFHSLRSRAVIRAAETFLDRYRAKSQRVAP